MMNTIATSGGVAAGIGTINSWSLPFFAVPLSVIGVAAFCSFLSFGYGDPIKDRKKLYISATFMAVVAIICVAILPPMLGWQWVVKELQAPLAGGIAISGRVMWPVAEKLAPELLRKWLKLDKKEDKGNE